MTPAQRDEELAFARALLADPYNARLRAVYGDWLSDEVGEVERAALVREAEGWPCDVHGGIAAFGWAFNPYPSPPRGNLYFVSINRHRPVGCVASVGWHRPRYGLVHVPPDGSSPDHPHNWAWLLALAVSRGLVLPDR
jgi:uncharacterized protein (TIGR02996 family)